MIGDFVGLPLSLKQRIPQIQLGLFHTLTYTSKLTVRVCEDKRDEFNFPIVNFPFVYSNSPTVPSEAITW